MAQYNTLNVTLSNSQLNKLKSALKNGTEVTLNLSSSVTGDSNDENNFPHKLLLTNTKVSKICKAFANGASTNIKFSKTQLHKIGQSGGFLGRLFAPLLKNGLPLIGKVIKPLANSVLMPFGLTAAAAAAAAADAAIHKQMLKSGFTTLIISNEEINDIMKIVEFPQRIWVINKRRK